HRGEPGMVDVPARARRQRVLRGAHRGARGDPRAPGRRRQLLRRHGPDGPRLRGRRSGLEGARLVEHPAAVRGARRHRLPRPDRPAGEGVLDSPNLARLDPAAWEYSMFNGRIYGLPYPSELVTDAVFYRRDLFEELGVEPPTDAESFLEVLSEITDPGANRWG